METKEAVAQPEASGAASEAGWRGCFHQKSPMMDSEAPEDDSGTVLTARGRQASQAALW